MRDDCDDYDDYDDGPDGGDFSYEDRICDDDCRGANNCYGHAACEHCGEVVCGCSLEDDLCEACFESRTECENCGEVFFFGDGAEYKASDGAFLCSQECLDDWESGLESGRIESDKPRDAADEGAGQKL